MLFPFNILFPSRCSSEHKSYPKKIVEEIYEVNKDFNYDKFCDDSKTFLTKSKKNGLSNADIANTLSFMYKSRALIKVGEKITTND